MNYRHIGSTKEVRMSFVYVFKLDWSLANIHENWRLSLKFIIAECCICLLEWNGSNAMMLVLQIKVSSRIRVRQSDYRQHNFRFHFQLWTLHKSTKSCQRHCLSCFTTAKIAFTSISDSLSAVHIYESYSTHHITTQTELYLSKELCHIWQL